MAVTANRFTERTDFFKSHTPFQIPTGTGPTRVLSDMVSIDYIVPPRAIKINQTYGTGSRLEFTIIVKNITTNIELEFEIVHENYFSISTSKNFSLGPLAQQNILVTANNSYINTLSTKSINLTSFKVLVKNPFSSDLAYVGEVGLPRKSFDSEITFS
jgi:hypothetical protein